jgi:cell division protein FtsI (penicillin-binding protein 3)
VGFAPVTNPAIVVVVTLNGTHGTAGFGGEAAAPAFKAVATEALRILDVPKDLPDDVSSKTMIARNQAVDDDVPFAGLGDGQPNILEDRDDENPPVQPPPAPAGTVPNFQGMTLRAVLMEAAAKGLPVQPDGSGVARLQTPPPGAVLHQGERIRVQFAR